MSTGYGLVAMESHAGDSWHYAPEQGQPMGARLSGEVSIISLGDDLMQRECSVPKYQGDETVVILTTVLM